MPIANETRRFTRRNVASAPDTAGVYALLGEDGVAFIGGTRGDETIRSRLRDHLAGRAAPGPGAVRSFSVEVTRFPLARECALLEEHMRLTWRLPVYNQPAQALPFAPERPAA